MAQIRPLSKVVLVVVVVIIIVVSGGGGGVLTVAVAFFSQIGRTSISLCRAISTSRHSHSARRAKCCLAHLGKRFYVKLKAARCWSVFSLYLCS